MLIDFRVYQIHVNLAEEHSLYAIAQLLMFILYSVKYNQKYLLSNFLNQDNY